MITHLSIILSCLLLVALCQNQKLYDICDEELPTITESGVLLTPNRITGEEQYATDLTCNTSLVNGNEGGGSIRMLFNLFDVENFENCGYDYLAINGEKYCAVLSQFELCMKETQVDLYFFSDFYKTPHTGFEIDVTITPENICDCMTEANVETGVESKICVKSYIYEGITRHQCTLESSTGNLICATAVDENGTLTEQGNCNTSLQGCQQKCLSKQGNKCLIPYIHGSSGLNAITCHNAKGRIGEERKFTCPTKRGRDSSSADVNSPLEDLEIEECDEETCLFLEPCGSDSTAAEGQIISRVIGEFVNYGVSHDTNMNCNFSFTSLDSSKYYSFEFFNLDTWCDDKLYIKDPSGSFVYSLCSKTIGTNQGYFKICAPSSQVEIDFLAGPKNDKVQIGRYGFSVTYEQIDPSECAVESTTLDTACTNPEGRNITSNEIIKGPMFPQAYPSNSFCLWNIYPPNPDDHVFVQAIDFDFGIENSEFETVDSLTISDSAGRKLEYGPTTEKPYNTFLSLNDYASINFTSSEIYNWHQNFEISISLINIIDDREVFLESGFCLSEDLLNICQFPFEYKGKTSTGCDFLDGNDTHVSCLSIKGEKIKCNTDIDRCKPDTADFISADIGFTDSDTVTLSWSTSSRYWAYFDIKINGQIFRGAFSGQSIVISRTDFETATARKKRSTNSSEIYSVAVFMKSFTLDDRSIFYLIDLDTQVAFLAVNPADVNLIWASGITVEKVLISANLIADAEAAKLQTLAENLGADLSDLEVAPTDPSNTSLVLGNIMTPGIPYILIVETSTTNVTFNVNHPPTPLTLENANLTFAVNEIGIMEFSGILSSDTICSAITIQVVEATIQSDNVTEEEPFLTEVCSLANNCIDLNGNFSTLLQSDRINFGVCYIMYISSSTVGISSQISKNEFCSKPPAVNVSSIVLDEVETTSMQVSWSAPETGFFDVYDAVVTYCSDCSCNTIETLEEYRESDPTLRKENLIPGVKYMLELRTVINHGIIDQKLKFSDPVFAESDSLAVDPKSDRAGLEFSDYYVYLNWAVPIQAPDSTEVIGYRSGFQVTMLNDQNEIETNFTRETGSSRHVRLNFTQPGHMYTIKLQTVSCSGTVLSDGFSYNQIAPPFPPISHEFFLVGLTDNGFSIQCNRNESEDTDIAINNFIITVESADRSIASAQMDCSDDQSKVEFYDSDTFEPSGIYFVIINTRSFSQDSEVQEVMSSEPLNFTVQLFPSDGGMELTETSAEITIANHSLAMPEEVSSIFLVIAEVEDKMFDLRNASDFHTWKESYLNDSLSSYQATENLNFPPTTNSSNLIVTDGKYSFKIGTDTYDSCIAKPENETCDGPLMPNTLYIVWFFGVLNESFVTGRQFGAFRTKDLTTSFEAKLVGSTSMSFKFVDDITNDETIYHLTYQEADGSTGRQKRSTPVTISEKRGTICASGECLMYVHGLKPATTYIFSVEFEIFGFRYEQPVEITESTLSSEQDVTLAAATRTSVDVSAILPSAGDPTVKEIIILVGVEKDNLTNVSEPYNTWSDIFANDNVDKTGVYQAFPAFNLTNLDDVDGLITSVDGSRIRIQIGKVENCQNIEICNGELTSDSTIHIWFVTTFADNSTVISGPYGSFKAANTQDNEFLSAGIGLIFAVIFVILILILIVLLCVYYKRHGRKKKRGKIPPEHVHPFFVGSPESDGKGSVTDVPDLPPEPVSIAGLSTGYYNWGGDDDDNPRKEPDFFIISDEVADPRDVIITANPNQNNGEIPRLQAISVPETDFVENPVSQDADQVPAVPTVDPSNSQQELFEAEFAANPVN